MRLLFITQKIHEKDDDLAFVTLWIDEFIRQGIPVEVICLEKGEFDGRFSVHSLGKEKGYGRLRRLLNFLWLISYLRYDRVFVHMNPEYFTFGGWFWYICGIPSYFWFTHYTNHIHVKLAAFFSKRMFAATPQSLPHYEGNPKKIVTGHGIDTSFWLPAPANTASPFDLVSVHRLCRSKRVEIGIEALLHLPPEYTLTIYGREVEKDYVVEIKQLVKDKGLESRVTFVGPVPMPQLKEIYPRYRLMVNMAYETIDKTMLEGMLFGIYPITTKGNSLAIGLSDFPVDDSPQAVADFIVSKRWEKHSQAELQNIVEEKHSLSSLIRKMSEYIRKGI